jgi:hypothetical protein
MVFNDSAKGLCEFTDDDSADAVMIDLDSIGALVLLEEYLGKHPRRPVIGLSVKKENIANVDEILIKPVKILELCATIKRVADGVIQRQPGESVADAGTVPSANPAESIATEIEPNTQTVPMLRQNLELPIIQEIKSQSIPLKDFKNVCGVAEDIDIENPEHIARILMPINGRLLGVVMYAISESEHQQVPIAVSMKQKYLFTLFPRQQTASFTIKDDMLQRLCVKSFPTGSFGFKAIPDLLPDMDDPLTVSKEQMLWKMAAWTYCGKLPQDAQLQERVYLRHWPNLTRLLELPDAMRISALLVDQPMSLARVTEALDIPQRHIFAYYSAAHAIGLMGRAKRSSDYLLDPPPPPAQENANRKLLGRMVHHLRKLLS